MEEEIEGEEKGREKTVEADHLFFLGGLVPPGTAEHSVKILHFKINHSRLSTEIVAHTRMYKHTHNHTFMHVRGLVFQMQVSEQRAIVVCCDSMTRLKIANILPKKGSL